MLCAVCHELRNPLHVLKSAVSLLEPTLYQGGGGRQDNRSDASAGQLPADIVASANRLTSASIADGGSAAGSSLTRLKASTDAHASSAVLSMTATDIPATQCLDDDFALLNDVLDVEEQKELMLDIHAAIERMEATVNDVLDFRHELQTLLLPLSSMSSLSSLLHFPVATHNGHHFDV